MIQMNMKIEMGNREQQEKLDGLVVALHDLRQEHQKTQETLERTQTALEETQNSLGRTQEELKNIKDKRTYAVVAAASNRRILASDSQQTTMNNSKGPSRPGASTRHHSRFVECRYQHR